MTSTISAATRRRIADQYKHGTSSYALGEHWSLSPTHVLRIVREHGVRVRTATQSLILKNQVSDGMASAIVHMYKNRKRKGGLAMRLVDVAERYDLPITKVRKVLLSKRVKIRPRGRHA